MKENISIIIPTRNRKQDIIECIDSICSQTLLPDELIIVDSSDTSELNSELKKHFKEKLKIRYFVFV